MRRLVAAALVFMPLVVHAQYTVGKAMTGNEYLRLSSVLQSEYVTGVVDGMLFAPVIARSNLQFTNKIESCFATMRPTRGQLKAIADHYLQANPAEWGLGMHGVVFQALRQACYQAGQPLD
jgi:hypothetical protein